MKNLILLGYGFTGEAILQAFLKAGFQVIVTSRNPEKLPDLPEFVQKIKFDLLNKATWTNLPDQSELIWMFPAEPIEAVKSFLEFARQHQISCRIILGTTSSFLAQTGQIDEKSELDFSRVRVQGEKLLFDKGAVWLQCSGLWGGDRQPVNWLNKGLIKNGNKTLNLIHRDDIAEIAVQILAKDIRSDMFCLSDGKPYLWKNLLVEFKKSVQTSVDSLPDGPEENRQISNAKIAGLMGEDFRFRKLV
ncbi:MAG: NAD(P)-binding domain-containing protein [Bacteroidetes bacterium]|nr:NAD(P)-binding domain-containing protein [Bacteroidota bacterium]